MVGRIRFGRLLFIVVVLGGLYLALWPVGIAPVAFQPPKAPELTGPYAANSKLVGVDWLGKGIVKGPESTAIDASGRVYAGIRDGKVLRLRDDGTFETFVDTGGKPFGMTFDGAGNLIVCDARKGLLSVSPQGAIQTLATAAGGVPFKFTDDVDVASDGTIYFTDASSKFDDAHYLDDTMEHGANGRFMAYHPATQSVEVLIPGMHFANGVALSGDQSFVLVNETTEYRIRRYWLAGPKKGTADIFIDNLPGFPDNVTFSKSRGIFWVALFAPRNPPLDSLAGMPWARKVVSRLPRAIQPKAARVALAVGLDTEGRVVQFLEDDSPDSFSPVTSVRESNGTLWLGSLERDALGRIKAPQ